MIHAGNLKDQLKNQKNLNLDATRADIKLIEQLEVLADTLYIKVTDLILSWINLKHEAQLEVFVFFPFLCFIIC